METVVSFGGWLKRRRKALDLTQKDLAALVGCSVAAIQKIEREERRPSRQIAVLLANALEIPEDQRPLFLKIARGERRVEGLPSPNIGIPHDGLGFVHTGQRLGEAPAASAEVPPVQPAFHLPYPPNPLIGRESELDQIAHLLQEDHCRLLTLTGEGGIGKTRLVIEVGRLVAGHTWDRPDFSGGVYFVSLTAVRAIEGILPALADGIGFKFYGAQEPMEQICQFLAEKKSLLILDNLEHLVEGANLFAEIISRAPGVKVLVTSRERLKLQGEWVFELSGLPYPVARSKTQVAGGKGESYSAVALFIQNARRRTHNFELTPEIEPAIFEICRLVDGMPLGLELAAAWLSTLTPAEIASEIKRDLDFLTAPTRDIPERHRSIHAVFDHSFELLSAETRNVFCRLSVFQGGFRRAAAEIVAGGNLRVLSELVEKSLLRRLPNGRYDQHELVRQYAGRMLQQDPEAYRAVRELHTGFYLSLLKTWESGLRDHHQKEALEELTLEIANIGLAWDWAVANRQILNMRKGTVALMVYHELRNMFQEGESLFEKAQAAIENGNTPEDETELYALEVLLGDILSQQAWFSFRLGKMGPALAILRKSIGLLRKYNEVIVYGDVLWYYAFACWFAGEYEEATWAITQGLDLNAALGRHWQIAMLKINQGGVAHEQGKYEPADEALTEALVLARSTGDPRLITTAISFLGRTRQTLGRFHGLQELYQEALTLATETGDRYGQGLAIERLAYIAQATGEAVEALRLYEVCTELYKDIGDRWSQSRAYNELGRFAFQQADEQGAKEAYQQAMSSAIQAGATSYLLESLVGIAMILNRKGKLALAVEIAEQVSRHPSSTLYARSTAQELLEEISDRQNNFSAADVKRSFAELVDTLPGKLQNL